MNPFKWAKAQIKKFLASDDAAAPQVKPRVAVSEKTKLTAAQIAKRNAPRPLPLGAKWFWISTKRVVRKDPRTGEDIVGYEKRTYVRGAKRHGKRAAVRAAARKRAWEFSPRQVSLAAWMVPP